MYWSTARSSLATTHRPSDRRETLTMSVRFDPKLRVNGLGGALRRGRLTQNWTSRLVAAPQTKELVALEFDDLASPANDYLVGAGAVRVGRRRCGERTHRRRHSPRQGERAWRRDGRRGRDANV